VDIEEVLEKSIISLKVEFNEKEQKCIYYKIEFSPGRGMSYNKFIKPLQKKDIETTSNEEIQTKLFLNYKKFVDFLEKIKEYIINKLKELKEKKNYDLSLLIKLKIQKQNENGASDFKNIWCQYILKKPNYCDINEEYIEKNILNLEKYEILEKFLEQIIEINYGEI
jgi:F0F1-type ATP synthase gamma subunit